MLLSMLFSSKTDHIKYFILNGLLTTDKECLY